MAEVIVRREPTAEASFADIRARIRFGIAIAAIVRMIDTAISNSISEKPFALRNLHLPMTDRHFDPQLSCAGILGAIRREQAINARLGPFRGGDGQTYAQQSCCIAHTMGHNGVKLLILKELDGNFDATGRPRRLVGGIVFILQTIGVVKVIFHVVGQPDLRGGRGYSDSICSAIASIFVTLFQFRAVPETPTSLSTLDQGSLDLPAPLGK